MKKLLLSLSLLSSLAFAQEKMTVYKSPSCGCCGEWIKYMEKNGYEVETILSQNMYGVKKALAVPKKLGSCHTAIIDGYIVEGHVPADVVDKMLKERPDIIGIASPGMPIGSPGMEQGDIKQPNPIVSFDKNHKFKIYANR